MPSTYVTYVEHRLITRRTPNCRAEEKVHTYRFTSITFCFFSEREEILFVSRYPVKISITIPVPVQSDKDEPTDRYMHTMVRCCTFDKKYSLVSLGLSFRRINKRLEMPNGVRLG